MYPVKLLPMSVYAPLCQWKIQKCLPRSKRRGSFWNPYTQWKPYQAYQRLFTDWDAPWMAAQAASRFELQDSNEQAE
jgi:hypothetical protein